MSGFESSLADEWDRFNDGGLDVDDLLDRADVERKRRIEDGLCEVSASSGWGAAKPGEPGGDAVLSNDPVVGRPG